MAKAYNMWPMLMEKDKALKSLKHLFKIFKLFTTLALFLKLFSFRFLYLESNMKEEKTKKNHFTLNLISLISLSLFLKISSFQFLCGSQSKEGMIGFVTATRDVVKSGGPVASCLFFYLYQLGVKFSKCSFFLAIL